MARTSGHWILRAVLALGGLGLAGGLGVYVLLFYPLVLAGQAEPIRIETGLVQGLTQGGVSVYRGIPFAAAPIGDLRWRAPQPATSWQGVRDASRFAPVCMQSGETVPGLGVEPTSEDCLYLNIWTPAEEPTGPLPVMVWLYGGGHHVGSGSARLYWGDRIAGKGVIVVTLNYRLGAFGMMAHPELSAEAEYGASGNYLLLDQIAALQWVQRNIAAFGGDPGNVTLFGQSAGGTSISRLMVSPLTEGLFQRAIAQSGGDLRGAPDTVSLTEAEQIGLDFAAKLGAPSLAELRALPAAEILANDIAGYFDNGTPEGPHKINVDGYVLPGTVSDAYAQGREHHIPLLVGYNSGDDPLIHRGAGRRWAHVHAQGGDDVFAYYFTKVPPYPPFRFRGIAGHGAELIYLFGFPPPAFFYAVEFPWNAARDAKLSDMMLTYWTNFAATGDPNGEAMPLWPDFNEDENVLEFGDAVGVIELPQE
jgi:para-nitrobenzyl esterase